MTPTPEKIATLRLELPQVASSLCNAEDCKRWLIQNHELLLSLTGTMSFLCPSCGARGYVREDGSTTTIEGRTKGVTYHGVSVGSPDSERIRMVCDHTEWAKAVNSAKARRDADVARAYEAGMRDGRAVTKRRCASVAREVGNKWSNDARAVSEIVDAIRAESAVTALCTFGPPAQRRPHWILRFEDADMADMHFDDETEAMAKFNRCSQTWNCTLFVTATGGESDQPPATGWVSVERVNELRKAITDFSLAASMSGGPSLAMQRHDPTWSAWKRLCEVDAGLSSRSAKDEAREDERLFGTSFVKRHPDGTEERIDPSRVTVLRDGRVMIKLENT